MSWGRSESLEQVEASLVVSAQESARGPISQDDFAGLAITLHRSGSLFTARKQMLAYVARQMPGYLNDLRTLTEKYSHVRSEVAPAVIFAAGQDMAVVDEMSEKAQMTQEVLDFMRRYREKASSE